MSATLAFVEQALALRERPLPAEVRRMALRCLMDVVGCAVAGSRDPAFRLVFDELADAGGRGESAVFQREARLPAASAALANGTAAHALDYDDVNVAIPGHASAVLMPTLLALAEAHGRTGAEVVTSFVVGYEATCRLGAALAPGHYERGFHATATLGSVGAALAAACLLGLDAKGALNAVGLGATQGAGLKNLFGTMGKPLHAGLAARNAVTAARLASRGFEASADPLAGAQGFAAALGAGFDEETAARPPGVFFILSNLFKYHASCYGTHATLECARAIREQAGFEADEVERVELVVPPGSDSYCNIEAPATGNEGKFSLRLNAAFGLLGIDTAALAAYDDAAVQEPKAVALRDRVRVGFDPQLPMMATAMIVRFAGGAERRVQYDAARPEADLVRQAARLEAKFRALAEPVLGGGAAARLLSRMVDLESAPSVEGLISLTAAGPARDAARLPTAPAPRASRTTR